MIDPTFRIGDIVAISRDNGRVHFLIAEVEETECMYGFTVLQSSGALGVWKSGQYGTLHFGTIDNLAKKVA